MRGKCIVPGCSEVIKGRDCCSAHLQRFRKHGSSDAYGKRNPLWKHGTWECYARNSCRCNDCWAASGRRPLQPVESP